MNIFKIMIVLRILFLALIIFLIIKRELDYKEFLVGFISIIFFSELLAISYISGVLGEILIFISDKIDRITATMIEQIKKIVNLIL